MGQTSQTCGCGGRHGGSVPLRQTLAPVALLPEDTVETAIRRSPDAPEVLRGFGIDTCCGGRLTLGQAAASAGVPVDAILEALGARRGGMA